MNTTIQIVPIGQVKIGMHITCGASATGDCAAYQISGVVESEAEIKALIDDGYTSVTVDFSKCRFPADATGLRQTARPVPQPDRGHFLDSAVAAKQTYDNTLALAKDYIRNIRLGREIDLEETARVVNDLVDAILHNGNALQAISKLSAKDDYTYTHCVNVAVLGIFFGRYLGMSPRQLEDVGKAGFLHDIGKAFVPDDILNKPGPLTDTEFTVIKEHPRMGHDLVVGGIQDESVLYGILQHHERRSGKGYPSRLRGSQIHSMGQLIGIVDIYDALTSARVYKPAMLPNKALAILYGMRADDFEPDIVDSFIKCLGIYPMGSFVRLTDGSVAMVCEATGDPVSPRVVLCKDDRGARIKPRVLDLSISRDQHIDVVLNPADVGIDQGSLMAAMQA